MNLYESLIKNVGLGTENVNEKYIDSLIEGFKRKRDDYEGFITNLLNATGLDKLKDERFIERAIKKTYDIQGAMDGDLSFGSVYNQKFDYGSLLGIYGVFKPLAGGSSKYISPIRFYQYGIQVLALSGVDYSKIDKLFKKKDLTKDNYYANIRFDCFDYQISDCKVLLQYL